MQVMRAGGGVAPPPPTPSSGRGCRTVRLTRRPLPASPRPAFGFSLRGGREHHTGFFVSAVQPHSDAYRQGLRVGDQVVRINGFPVEDAVHQEVLHYIQLQNHLTLKVRTVGMIPVKEKKTDPLTWCMVDNKCITPLSFSANERNLMPPPNIFNQEDGQREVRLFLNVASRAKLGCGICKGPDWHQGIFVQFTKENGLAREVGLRPGDQIVECNGVKFLDVSFNEAVSILKGSKQLDLVVRKGAGLDLFPGESSGYNSSASSVTGDQSPSWEDTKRLSVVKEESADLEDRLGQLNASRNVRVNRNKDWDQIEYEWEKAEKEEIMKQKNHSLSKKSNDSSITGSCTVIHLGEDGVTSHIEERYRDINASNSSDESSRIAEIRMVSQQQETTTVVVEVHRTEEGHQPPPPCPPPPAPAEGKTTLVKSVSTSSCMSECSIVSANSLSSAISQELQRRLQRRESGASHPEEPKKKPFKAPKTEVQQRHEQLMEEFKEAHRKMFANLKQNADNCDDGVEKSSLPKNQTSSEDRSASRYQKRQPNDEHNLQRNVHTASSIQNSNQQAEQGEKKQTPPPPPLPTALETQSDKSWAVRVGALSSVTSTAKSSPASTPPSCPTPDYDNTSIASSISSQNTETAFKQSDQSPKPLNKILTSHFSSSVISKPVHIINKSNVRLQISENLKPDEIDNVADKVPESVEMESLESFKLTNPGGPPPKPPSTYFLSPKQRKSTASSSSSSSSDDSSSQTKLGVAVRKQRPVSVTIGEYPSGTERRQPSKFDFLGTTRTDSKQNSRATSPNEPMTSLLQSELAMTLSKSNLKKRTEQSTQDNILNGTTSVGKPSKGTVTISVNSDLPSGSNLRPTQISNIESQKNENQIVNNTASSKIDLFNGHIKNNVKPSILSTAEKLGSKSTKNTVTIIVSNKSEQ